MLTILIYTLVNAFEDVESCVLYYRDWIMPWWQEEMLRLLVHRLLPRSMRYLIGRRNQRKACCFLLTRLMHFYASKLPSSSHILSNWSLKNDWNILVQQIFIGWLLFFALTMTSNYCISTRVWQFLFGLEICILICVWFSIFQSSQFKASH